MKKIIFIASLLYCLIVLLTFFSPQPITAQNCSCSWTGPGTCQPDDPSGCPPSMTAKITFCDDTSQSCLCQCVAPPPPPCTCKWISDGNCQPQPPSTGGCPDGFGPQITYCDNNTEECLCSCQFGYIPPTSGGGVDIHGPCGPDKINTAIGCIPISDTQGFAKWLLGWGVGIAGGVAILLMIAGAFMVIASGADPNKVKAGSELITSAIAGLLFIIFSLFLLRLIGVEILQIPGL